MNVDGRPFRYLEAVRTSHHASSNPLMTGRLITVNDISSFDPNAEVCLEELNDIIGRNFKQPEERLGFDKSPVAHMWRTMIWPTKYLSSPDQPAGQRPRVGLGTGFTGTGFTAGGVERRTSEGAYRHPIRPPSPHRLGPRASFVR